MKRTASIVTVLLIVAGTGFAQQQSFKDLVGPIEVGEVKAISPLDVRFIFWGGDMATFYANGGADTAPGSIFDKQGLKIRLSSGDDFIAQVRDYVKGKTPFLRGTLTQIAMASEVIGADPRTKGVLMMQMTWSTGGDHCVARPGLKTIGDLKGKKICLQKGGPHVGLLDDILKTAKLKWDDITVVWADDISGTDKSPDRMFRKDETIAACFVVTPDMVGLTGGADKTGTGAEGTVKGARDLVSTAQLSHSIADVYVCRKDFYEAHKDVVTKFVAGYLKACEEIVELRKKYDAGNSPEYKALLQTTQKIFGQKSVPTLDDAHGLWCDCTPVGYPGNLAFLTEKNNPNGMDAVQEAALDLAAARGFTKVKQGLFKPDFDWSSKTFVGYLTKTDVKRGERFAAEAVASEIEKLAAGALDERTILVFTINFDVNQSTFSEVQYGAEFQRVVEALGKFGNAVVAVRGHSDTTLVLSEAVQAGLKKGVLQRTGKPGDWKYSLNGKPLDVAAVDGMMKLIEDGTFDGVEGHNPREVMQAGLNLSKQRSDAVKEAICKYAESKGLKVDKSQIATMGVGIKEPFIAKPKNEDEAKQNRRVEFRLMRVSAETMKPTDFDF